MEIVFTLTFYMLIECIVPFLVEWFCLYVGGGGGVTGGHDPLDFFLFCQMEILYILTFHMLMECIVPFPTHWSGFVIV